MNLINCECKAETLRIQQEIFNKRKIAQELYNVATKPKKILPNFLHKHSTQTETSRPGNFVGS